MTIDVAPERHVLVVLDGGLQTTVQDDGRPGHEASGLGRGGAADRAALAVANLLAGNPPDTAALEATLLPPTLEAMTRVRVGVAGADLGYVLEPTGRRIGPPCAVSLQPGDRLVPGGTGTGGSGVRVYLAPAGGIHVPTVLGSRSTFLPAGFGGHEGRPLVAGDRIALGVPRGVTDGGHRPLAAVEIDLSSMAGPIRVLLGPAAAGRRGRALLESFVAASWSVSADSDRRGLRLVGGEPVSTGVRPADGPSQGVRLGAIQLTPDGMPLVLMPDAGPTGGYPVIAVVVAADVDRLGQLGPGAPVAFRPVGLRTAIAAEVARRAWLDRLVRLALDPARPESFGDDPHGRWDDAWHAARG